VRKLKGLSDIRNHFYRNETPIYFVSATAFNLQGMDEWVRNFHFINYIDCFDGMHAAVMTPSQRSEQVFSSIEEINNHLLEHPEVRAYVKRHGKGQAVFLFFDDKTEKLCKGLGLEIAFPPAKLRQKVDDKITTTRIGDEAGVPSVPNALARVEGYDSLMKLARKARLGEQLVVQTAYGDSGHTTFFISSEADYRKHAEEIEAESEVKVMKKIHCRGSAIEACVTRQGTVVGPLMTELVGFPELTPYKGGWCGNEVFPGAFSQKVRDYARKATFRIGEALKKRGYRGYFELDYLLDMESDKVYLGEMNPRITGASSMTNLAAFAHADAPLFLIHLLEWSGRSFELDVEEINRRWSLSANIDSWSQLVIKHTRDSVERITAAPRTGVWELGEDGVARFVRIQTHRRTVQRENRGFYLRIAGEGDYFYEGGEMGILVIPGRAMTRGFKLTQRARSWIDAIRAQYRSEGLAPAHPAAERAAQAAAASFKYL
jgi:biotin carboxylase